MKEIPFFFFLLQGNIRQANIIKDKVWYAINHYGYVSFIFFFLEVKLELNFFLKKNPERCSMMDTNKPTCDLKEGVCSFDVDLFYWRTCTVLQVRVIFFIFPNRECVWETNDETANVLC